MSIMDTKLRSFNISNNKTYERFKQIQLERGKNASLRLNQLIEKEVKEADPQFKELNAVRSKDAPDIITPNPFLKSQSHSLPEWAAGGGGGGNYEFVERFTGAASFTSFAISSLSRNDAFLPLSS